MKDRVLSDATTKLYCGLMEEVKRRTGVIYDTLSGRVPVPEIVGVEICYLQIRFICELIALACLTAHGDVPGAKAKRLTTAYHPDTILKSLEKLHASFYPVPGRQVLDESGKVTEIVSVEAPFLTKQDLLKLYGECGNFLHRGSLENVIKGKRTPELASLLPKVDKIRTLLSHHQIQLADPDWQLWVLMRSNKDDRVHAWQFQRVSTLPVADSAVR